ncbi:MAG: glycosyltransferase family 4 protein [Alphaproteobacteria bacterium]|nr:glycosyltransferase family 4 protein [Alphaproteobacteria bacterium]
MTGGIKKLARYGLAGFWGSADRLGLWRCRSAQAAYIVERGASWSIRWDGSYYAQAVNGLHPGTLDVTDRPERLVNRIAHFGSQFIWELWTKSLHASNRQLLTYFHGKPEDGPDMARHVDFFLKNMGSVQRVVTAASLIERRLLSWGVPSEKLVRVPLGVDTSLFTPPTSPEERKSARTAFEVPEDALCIGSFQKDGIGWGDGMEPKLIKGPDLFVAAAARLAKRFPIFVLLTGPARGFVKAGLERHGIPYRHIFLSDYTAIAQAYRALDLYLMTSREEGGPKALLECLASGVPLVSNRVGMAEDLFTDPNDPRMAETSDFEDFCRKAERQLDDASLRQRLVDEGRGQIAAYDWQIVGRQLYELAYRPLLES